jgi:hypothetical protein
MIAALGLVDAAIDLFSLILVPPLPIVVIVAFPHRVYYYVLLLMLLWLLLVLIAERRAMSELL